MIKQINRKVIASLSITALLFLAVAAMAVPVNAAKNGQAGTSNTAHQYLYEKDASWSIVAGGAWGKMTYNLAGPTFDFVFNGHNLLPSTAYTLIYYADPWPGNNPGATILSGTSDSLGDINLVGSVDLNMDISTASDDNYPRGKIWLVLSSDYFSVTNSMTVWNPSEYLFENNLITYDDTDVP